MKRIVIISFIVFIATAALLLEACRKNDSLAPGASVLKFEIPPGFPDPTYKFDNNTPTQQGFELGRKLFYDGKLSMDGNFPCASCHQQFAAFCTFDHPRSHGFNNQFTLRNAPGLFNMAWVSNGLHWDGGINNLEVQPLSLHKVAHDDDAVQAAETQPGSAPSLRSESEAAICAALS